eukprot:1138065-Pelagomonas_calceolata.AAC.5
MRCSLSNSSSSKAWPQLSSFSSSSSSSSNDSDRLGTPIRIKFIFLLNSEWRQFELDLEQRHAMKAEMAHTFQGATLNTRVGSFKP